MIKKQVRKTDIFQFNNLSEYNKIKHFVSTNIKKQDQFISNDLDISFNTGRDYNEILQNRKILSEAVEISLESFVIQDQVHSNKIKIISQADKGKGVSDHSDAVKNTDAMITNEKGLCLFIFAADCVPLLFFDPVKTVIGAAHSGRKGTLKKIAKKTILKMNEVYGSKSKDIIVGIGPSISVTNYEIGENAVQEIDETFGTKNKYLKYNNTSGKYHMDLWYSNKKQLLETGILENNIEIASLCTFENPEIFFSARRNKKTGRFAAGIILI